MPRISEEFPSTRDFRPIANRHRNSAKLWRVTRAMTDSVLDVLFSIGEFIFTCRLVRWVCLALGLALAFFYRAAIMQDEVISRWLLIGLGIWILFEFSFALYAFYNGERGRDFWLSAP